MSHSVGQDDFKWGEKMDVIVTDNDVKFYRSFIYRGEEYSLYDSVCMFREGAKETDIGKLIKIWEKRKEKKVKILWFFWPIDISSFLRDYEPSWNELFLASGAGKGLCSIVPLKAIIGKCSVICTSTDRRNPLPSKSVLGKAEYFFSHTFDVRSLRISETFPDKIDRVKVEYLFNREKPKASVKGSTGVTAAQPRDQGKSVQSMEKDGQVGTAKIGVFMKDSIVKDETSRISEDLERIAAESQPLKKRKIRLMGESDSASEGDPTSILDPLPSYGAKSPLNNASHIMHQNDAVVDKEPPQLLERVATNKETRSWFCELPWDDKVRTASKRETLVFLDSLDPSFLSSDIQHMISKAFKVEADAKIIPAGFFSNPSYGRALVIFNSKDDADFVIKELREKCLMIGGRPVVASRKQLGGLEKPWTFPGHLIIEKVKKMKWSKDKKNMVSTSHCTQANTSEHDMAIQWCMLQARSDLWWKALCEKQAEELSKLENQLRRHQSNQPLAGTSRVSKLEKPNTSSQVY